MPVFTLLKGSVLALLLALFTGDIRHEARGGVQIVVDYLLLTVLFNTGARIQEVVSLNTTDVRLIPPASMKFLAKGKKERICPLWPETAKLIKQFCHETGLTLHESKPFFCNHRGGRLTRSTAPAFW